MGEICNDQKRKTIAKKCSEDCKGGKKDDFWGEKKERESSGKGGDDLCCTYAFPLFSTPLSSPLSCIFPIVKTDVNAFGDHKLLDVKELFSTRKEFCTMFLV